VTDGVIEEILTHMMRALACARPGGSKWEGNVPFLYSIYLVSGRSTRAFADWLTHFRGEALPEQDLAEYLEERLGVRVQNLQEYADQVPVEVRGAVQEIWHEAHSRRRGKDGLAVAPEIIRRLVEHDVENYLGVTERRREEKASPLGFTSWWLTLDQTAFRVNAELRTRLTARPPASPVLSPDFLANYLSVGPIRRFLAKTTESRLPLMLDISSIEGIPAELLEVAESVREENKDLPERIIGRKVRDALNTAKRRMGVLAAGGSAKVQEGLRLAAAQGEQQS